MTTTSQKDSTVAPEFFLDITGEVCPLTFVKTRLLLERMAPGQVAEVRLKGADPLENVPRSVTDQGDIVLALEPADGSQGPIGVHVLRVLRGRR